MGIGGKIKASPSHFIVEEIPSYQPLGRGKHLHVNITKEGMTTRELQKRLALLFRLHASDIGLAGLKDKHARTSQAFSIHIGLNDEKYISEAVNKIKKNLPVKVNWAGLHPRKLRRGRLQGNKFIITITDIDCPLKDAFDRARWLAEIIHDKGLPNFYGVQRIGISGENVRKGYKILSEKMKIHNRWLRRYLISSYLSYLCNKYLKKRFERGLFSRLLRGDLAQRHDTGGVFWVEDLEREQTRFEKNEISFTAPIFGNKMRRARYESKELEEEVLFESKIGLEKLERLGIRGTRRLGRILPHIKVKTAREGIQLEFNLSKGGYATIVLREFTKNLESDR